MLTELQKKMLVAFNDMLDEECEMYGVRNRICWLMDRGFTRADCIELKFDEDDVNTVFDNPDDDYFL